MNNSTWTPAALARTAQAFWWDAKAARSFTSDGTGINTWTDRLRGIVLTRTASLSINRLASGGVYLSGANVRLTSTTITPSDIRKVTTFVVGQAFAVPPTTNSARLLVLKDTANAYDDGVNGAIMAALDGTSPYNLFTLYNTATQGVAASQFGERFVISTNAVDEVTSFRVNGRTGSDISTGRDMNLSSTTEIVVGGSIEATEQWNGLVGDVIVIVGDVSLNDRIRIEGYLAHKWDVRLSPGHRYAANPPRLGLSSAPMLGSTFANALNTVNTVRARTLTNGATLRVRLG